MRVARTWQLGARRDGPGREPGIAQAMLAALREIGVLGEPVWTTVGPVLHYADPPHPRGAGVPLRLNGVWLNLLNASGERKYGRMRDVPAARREAAKARVAALAEACFDELTLTTEVTDDDRVLTRTPQGNPFGYVQRGQELLAVCEPRWRIAWATAVDGNVMAVLQSA